ncbi:MAG: transcription elongation factor GreA [Candidatus Roizmanbacteria bacterium]
MKKVQFTQEGFEQIKIELNELITIKRPYTIDRLSKARAMGDLSENSEYTASKEDLAMLEGRIKELENVIKNAEIITASANNNIIGIGSKVIVQTDNINDEFMIVGEFEADPSKKKLSHTSPIGKALLGKKIGDAITIEVPIGKLEYRILDIKKI